ncbi:hypothetical protein HON58_01735, partial [Candidatus Peregrinibacteria bacterium]|nr:hypothetical protein [Candidatus Peregrinibacteria bacterium]
DEIAWYENDGSESFTKNSIMTGIDYPRDVAAADLDGDGDIDVVGTSIYDAELIWHENDGSENFTPHEITDTYVDGIQAMDIGDMDGDGDYDIVVNNDSRSDVAWWENDGSGNFTKNSISTSGYNHTSFEVLDLDEDGDNDFIGPRLGAGIGWWVNDGSQNFSWSDIASFTSPRGMGYADFDLDGDLDVVGADQISSGPIKWAENDGSMSFTEHLVTNNNVRTHDKHSVEAVDLTGDGYADFVVGGDTLSTIDLAWYENSGTAFEWDDSDDVDLATDTTAATTVTGLIANSEYYFERWAVDIYGNTSTAVPAAISVYTAAAVPGAPTIGTITATTSKVTIDVNGNPVSTEFLIQEDNSGDYVQADGSLAAGEIWQSATTWGTVTVTGLEPSSANSFQVKARNGDLTETAFGTASDAVALSNVPSAPTVSSASTSSINVIINENSNTSDAEYSIDVGGSYVQAGGNLDVGEVFQDYATWGGATGINVTGLSPATNHSVTVKARNTDLVETVASGAAADYTLPATPGAPTIGTITETTADVTVSTNGNPASATYIIQESTSGTYVQADGTLSVGEIWQNAAAWGTVTVTGLTPSSVNTFITKAKSLALDESAFGAGSSAVALSNIPSAPTVSAVSTSSINVIINQNSNSASASYSIPVGSNYVQADGSLGVGEVFQDYATWGGASGITVTGLAESTSYSFTVKARNADLVTTVASAVGSATTQTTPAPAQSTGSAGGGGGDNEEESESETEAAEESQEAEASEEVDSEEEVAEERITERDVPVEEREEMVEERAEELSESIDEEEPDVEVSAQEEEPLVEVNIDELFADIDQLEEFEEDESEEEEETAPVIEKSEEEQLVDRILTNDDADLTEEEKDSDQEAVNNLIEQYFEEYLDTDEETGETKRPTFYSSYDEAEEAREENPDDEIFDTSSDENEDGVSDIYQIKKNFPEDDGDEYSLVDDIVLGGDPYKADINLVTDIPRITNYGKGQKVRGGDVVFVVGTSKQQNLSIYILNEEKEVIKTINSRIDEGIKDVVFTELPAGKYYAVPAGDAGQGKPVKLIVEEESDDMKLVLIDDAYIMKMIFNMVQDYELVPEDFVPEKTYIEGHAEPGTTVIVSWKSVVLNSVVVADASQGYFKVEVPKKLALGNHDALVYAYDEDSLIYSITRRAAFRKVNE